MIEIEFDNIITDDDVGRGNFVLLGGRPGLEKIITIEKIIKKYHNKYDTLCFDFSYSFVNSINTVQSIQFVRDYTSGVEIIKLIEKFAQDSLSAKFVFIEEWNLLDSQQEWFVRMLGVLACEYKLVIIMVATLPKRVDERRNHLPIVKDFETLGIVYKLARKHIYTINRACYFKFKGKDKISFYLYNHYTK